MLKPVGWALLVSTAAWGKPFAYRDATCQVSFPGPISYGPQAISYVRPHLQFYLLSWPTSPSEATAFLAGLSQQARTRGCTVDYLTRNHANGLQVSEVLTATDRNVSQFYLLYGRCYEFRVCIHDGKKHPEVDAFLGSIRFRARTVNLRAAIQNYAYRPAPVPPPQPAPRYRPGQANPYTF